MKTADLKQISKILDQKIGPLQKEMQGMQKEMQGMQKEMQGVQKDIKVIKKDLSETRNDVKVLISYFDREYVNLRKRIEIIEDHLGITQPQ